jgi:mannosyltransferase OCH1-like enzyme
MLFGGRYKDFYPVSKLHPLQAASSKTKDADSRPAPFQPNEDPCRKGRGDSMYEKLREAKVTFSFRTDIPSADKPAYDEKCRKAVRDFFQYLDASPGRKEEFESALVRLTTGSGGFRSVPEKKIIIAPPGEMPDGLSITNLKGNFCWNGQPDVLFETLNTLSKTNIAPSGMFKHYPVLPRQGEETLLMREQIKTYLDRYGPELNSEQRERIQEVLKQSDEDAEIPQILHGIWFKLSKDVPVDCLENTASFLERMHSWRSYISSNDEESIKSSVSEFVASMGADEETVSASERITARSDKDFYERANISDALKTKIRNVINRELHPTSPAAKPNGPGAADFFRLCLLLLDGGLYMDMDTSVPKTLPRKMYAFFGVQLAVIPKAALQEPGDTNQFIMASKNKFAKEFLERVLEKMVDAYEQNPNLSRLVRHTAAKTNPFPDKLALDSLRFDALRSLKTRELLQSSWSIVKGKKSEHKRFLDQKVMERKAYDPKTKQMMTLLIGNQMCQVAKDMYGEHALDQMPDALGFLGKLWQTGHINALAEFKWSDAGQSRITPKIYSADAGSDSDSARSLASLEEDPEFPHNQVVPLPTVPLWRR